MSEEFPGYARRIDTGEIGDISSIKFGVVSGILHGRDKKRFTWEIGNNNIEFIEVASFNPESDNYEPDGKVLYIK